MAELSGTLSSIGLAPVIRLLSALSKTGRLLVSDGPHSAAMYFESGRVVGAVFESEQGLASVDAIVLALGGGHFEFDEHVAEREVNLTLEPNELERHMAELAEEQAEIVALLPSPMAVPRAAMDDSSDTAEVLVSRDAVRLLLAIDGRRRVADLARERGLLRTLRQLVELARLGLIEVDTTPEPDAEVSHRPPRASVAASPPPDAARGDGGTARPQAANPRPRASWHAWRKPSR